MIRINTLGDFDIKVRDESILDTIGANTKLIKLFKYFLTFQGKKLLPYKIIEDIWAEENYEDPINVLRTQISRIRSLFNLKQYNINPFFEIKYIDGYYLFQLKNHCHVDYLELELCLKKHQTTKTNEESLEFGNQVIALYKGEYLEELGSDHWIVPIRSRYNRLFVNSMTKQLEVLKKMEKENEILCLCEDLICQMPYEEIIHISYIESLVNVGEIRAALNHYVYYTSKMYNDLGANPSDKIVSVYKSIRQKEEHDYTTLSLNSLENELKDCDKYNGALICDNDYFKFLYNYKSRAKERKQDIENVFVGIITLEKLGYKELSPDEMQYYMTALIDIIKYGLRKGDTITKWNNNQILFMLSGIGEDNLNFLIERLKETFNKLINNEKLKLNIKIKDL